MNSKGTIKYASLDVLHFKDESRKLSRKSPVDSKKGRRSHSLDRTLDNDNSGDSREERQNRRQYMNLV